MSHLVISINTANAAFAEESGTECARILREIAKDIEGRDLIPGEEKKIHDLNGNKIGYRRY